MAAINATYDYDVIHWGDVRSYPIKPDYRQRIFHARGQYDEYDYDATRISFGNWYQDENVNLKSRQPLLGIKQNGSALLRAAVRLLVLIITPQCTPTWMMFSGR